MKPEFKYDIELKKTYAKDLQERDKAKLVKRFMNEEIYLCPTCEKMLLSTYKFCPECGQRLNQDLISFL